MDTQCNSTYLDFPMLGRREILADFDGGDITTDPRDPHGVGRRSLRRSGWSRRPDCAGPALRGAHHQRTSGVATHVATPDCTRTMAAIPARELRNHTAEVLRRVEAGEEIEVFKDNRPVAKIIPLSRRRQWLPASEIGRELVRLGPDTTGMSDPNPRIAR